jgi:hypothetical protein
MDLTWKVKDDGSCKPKARAILLGYQDPGHEHRATTTPVMTKKSRQMLLQIAAIKRWKTQKGDVSGAFLQERGYPGDLFCVSCHALKYVRLWRLAKIVIIPRVKRSCYVSSYFEGLGLVKMWLWKPQGKLRGMISCHVDDFVYTSGREDPEWENLREQYAWGSWEIGKLVQYGVLI